MGTQRAVSARRVVANRVNATKSTGPATVEGKERASRNRLCHGFFSRHVLLPGEDAAELDALRQELIDDIRPRGCVEKLLVERLVTAHWKLARLQQAEHRMIQECIGEDHKPKPAAEMLSRMIYCGTESDRISIYQNRLEGTIHRCMRELRYLRKQESVERRAMRKETSPRQQPRWMRTRCASRPVCMVWHNPLTPTLSRREREQVRETGAMKRCGSNPMRRRLDYRETAERITIQTYVEPVD